MSRCLGHSTALCDGQACHGGRFQYRLPGSRNFTSPAASLPLCHHSACHICLLHPTTQKSPGCIDGSARPVQLVVEKMLVAEGTSRAALGREAFTERVWAWKREYGGAITGQLRRLGASCDWGREQFTLDPRLSGEIEISPSACERSSKRQPGAGLQTLGSRCSVR